MPIGTNSYTSFHSPAISQRKATDCNDFETFRRDREKSALHSLGTGQGIGAKWTLFPGQLFTFIFECWSCGEIHRRGPAFFELQVYLLQQLMAECVAGSPT